MFGGPRYHLPSGKNPEPVFPHPFPWEESAHFRPLPLVCSSVNVYDKNTACDFERHKHSGDAMRSVLRDIYYREKDFAGEKKKDFWWLRTAVTTTAATLWLLLLALKTTA